MEQNVQKGEIRPGVRSDSAALLDLSALYAKLSEQSEQLEMPNGLLASKEIARRQDRLGRLAEGTQIHSRTSDPDHQGG